MVQLLVSYYLLAPLLGIKASGMSVSIVMFGLNRRGVCLRNYARRNLSVDIGQMEAGRSLGLSYAQTHENHRFAASDQKYSAYARQLN